MIVYVANCTPADNMYECVQVAITGFTYRGYEIRRFDISELYDGSLDETIKDPDVMVFGGVGGVQRALEICGVSLPPVEAPPESLMPFYKRQLWTGTLSEIRQMVDTNDPRLPLHVKPLHKHKLFTGTLIRAFRDLISTAGVNGSEEVLIQSPVTFVSEWRAYVLHGQIISVGHYKGDPLLFPHKGTMLEGLEAYNNRPSAFAMDWGVTEKGDTLLVEVNDGFALGNYSLRAPEYVTVFETRWRELRGIT